MKTSVPPPGGRSIRRAAAHPSAEGRIRMKMKDLERATGVGRETIRYYIREGLLPEPDRPARNVAWYDESFVDQIALIKKLQQERFLPLSVIKAIVREGEAPADDEVRVLQEIDGKVFSDRKRRGPRRMESLLREVSMDEKEVESLAAIGALQIESRDGDPWLDDRGVRIVELWSAMRNKGFTARRGFEPEVLEVYVQLAQWLAREELRIFTEHVAGEVGTEEARRMAEAGIEIMGEILLLLRETTLLQFISEGNIPGADPSSRGSALTG